MAGAVRRINLWSMPRCASTATMYAFAQRGDCKVFDEPLYASYLAAHPEQQRPYRGELLQIQSQDANQVVRQVILGDAERGETVRFYKHIASQFLPSMDRAFLAKTDHMIMVRHPFRVVASYFKTHGSVSVHDTGLPRLIEVLESLERIGYEPFVLDNTDLLNRPEPVLKAMCGRFAIDFNPAMLSWPKGGIAEDGIWAHYWYKGTHQSTGFKPEANPPHDAMADLPAHVVREADLALPLYQAILEHRQTFNL